MKLIVNDDNNEHEINNDLILKRVLEIMHLPGNGEAFDEFNRFKMCLFNNDISDPARIPLNEIFLTNVVPEHADADKKWSDLRKN